MSTVRIIKRANFKSARLRTGTAILSLLRRSPNGTLAVSLTVAAFVLGRIT